MRRQDRALARLAASLISGSASRWRSPRSSSARRRRARRHVPPASAARTQARVSSPTPTPGPSTKALQPAIGKKSRQLLGAVDGPDHDRQVARGIDRERLARAGDGDKPGAGPQRAARCEPCGPGRRKAAGDDDRMAAVILVSARLRPRKMREPQLRRVGEGLAAGSSASTLSECRCRRPRWSAMQPARQQHMAGLRGRTSRSARLDGERP